MGVVDLVVGRQPIFDADRRVVGYELLFRRADAPATSPGRLDGDLMTSTTLFSALGIGIGRIVGDKLAFCNADVGVLTGHVPILLPPAQTVVEVLETVDPSPEVVDGCRRLAAQGYTIALDDVASFEAAEPLLAVASIVKVDLRLVPSDELAALLERLGRHDVRLLAEKVETQEELERCRALGCDYFQGYLLARPRLVTGRTLDASSVARLRLAARLLEGDCELDEIERVVRAEPAMAYQLLQLAGVGAEDGLRRPVQSLREALVLLGLKRLQAWVAYLVRSAHGHTSEEDVVAALTRARMCELLAARLDSCLAGAAFAAGMLSSLDLLLGVPPAEALAPLSLDAGLEAAVLARSGPVGHVLADVLDHLVGEHDTATRCGLDRDARAEAGMAALAWALGVVHPAGPGEPAGTSSASPAGQAVAAP